MLRPVVRKYHTQSSWFLLRRLQTQVHLVPLILSIVGTTFWQQQQQQYHHHIVKALAVEQQQQQQQQQRRSTLVSWKKHLRERNALDDTDDGAIAIGWTLEERNETHYRVSVTVANRNGSHDQNMEEKQVTVNLPWKNADTTETELRTIKTSSSFATNDNLADSLWDASLAGAILLRHFALQKIWRHDQSRVLELGSGPGLCGWVAGSVAAHVTLTDHDDSAVKRLENMCPWNTGNFVARHLEWRNDHSAEETRNSFDVIIGSDVAYYFYLLRPLMDTVQSFLTSNNGMALFVGVANRQSLWDLYDNIRKGCYNQITDQHEPPWTGQTRMLLYRLQVGEWTEMQHETTISDINYQEKRSYSTIPIAFLWHERKPILLPVDDNFLQECDHVATTKDQEEMLISF